MVGRGEVKQVKQVKAEEEVKAEEVEEFPG